MLYISIHRSLLNVIAGLNTFSAYDSEWISLLIQYIDEHMFRLTVQSKAVCNTVTSTSLSNNVGGIIYCLQRFIFCSSYICPEETFLANDTDTTVLNLVISPKLRMTRFT